MKTVQKVQKYFAGFILLLIGLSILTSLYVNYWRLASEAGNKSVAVLIDFDDLSSLARSNTLSLEEVGARFKTAGATGVLIRERTVEELELAGHVALLNGEEVAWQKKLVKGSWAGVNPVKEHIYLVFSERSLFESVYQNLVHKKPAVVRGELGDRFFIALPLSKIELEKMGVGFVNSELLAMSQGGLAVVPRFRAISKPSEAYLEGLSQSLQEMPGLALVTFNDALATPEPYAPAVAEVIKKAQVPVGSFEFFPQEGLKTMGMSLDKNVVRVHAIAENELARYNKTTALERFQLAVSERNIRALYIRFFGMGQPGMALDGAVGYVADIQSAIEAEGLQTGMPSVPTSIPYSSGWVFLIGLGVLSGGVLLLHTLWGAQAFKWTLVISLIGLVGWTALLYLDALWARKLCALASVIIIPSLGCLLLIKEQARSLKAAILALLAMSAFSLVGALLMTGLLGDRSFMLQLNGFTGVKVAHLIPLLLVPTYFLFRGYHPVQRVQELWNTPLFLKHLLVAFVLLGATAIYILRTGNEATSLVSSWETMARGLLDQTMGVRPRTKEFLIGYPAMLALLYYGYDLRRMGLLIFGIIGQISLANTYAHIHTPLLISLWRSFNGLWLGVLLGLVALVVYGYCRRWFVEANADE